MVVSWDVIVDAVAMPFVVAGLIGFAMGMLLVEREKRCEFFSGGNIGMFLFLTLILGGDEAGRVVVSHPACRRRSHFAVMQMAQSRAEVRLVADPACHRNLLRGMGSVHSRRSRME